MKDMKMDMPMEDDTSEYDQHEVEEACRTLMEAEKIKKDSKLMALVNKEMGTKKEAINSIQGLRDKAAKMNKPYDDSGSESEDA